MKQCVTTLGTPCSGRWPVEWVRRVEEAESRLGRRVCGAATWDGGPCALAAEHGSGRCRYHGGHAGTGAPLGSANAQIHGLYARRLQRCGRHCPLWESCPFAGEDVLALPVKGRPVCAYEREEYVELMKHYFKGEEVREDLATEGTESTEREKARAGIGFRGPGSAEGKASSAGFVGKVVDGGALDDSGDWDDGVEEDANVDASLGLRFPGKGDGCPEPFLMHQLVLLTIMQTRAAAVLSQGALTDSVEVDSPGYKMKTAKPGAALEAFIRIAREYRALRGIIDLKKLMPAPTSMGIGSRLRPLMLRGRAALAEALVDLDAVEKEKAPVNLATENSKRTENLEKESGEKIREVRTTGGTGITGKSENVSGEEVREDRTTENTEGMESRPP